VKNGWDNVPVLVGQVCMPRSYYLLSS